MGMHLYAQVLTRIYNLYEQGESSAKAFVNMLAQQLFPILSDKLEQGEALVLVVVQTSVGAYAFVSWHSADFPTLSDVLFVGADAFERSNFITAPDDGFQIRFEFVGLHDLTITRFDDFTI